MSRSESMRSLVAGGEGRSRAGLHLRARREPRDQTLDRLAVPSPVLARPPGRLDAPLVQLRLDGGHRHALAGELLNERSQVLGECLRLHRLLERLLIRAAELHAPRLRAGEAFLRADGNHAPLLLGERRVDVELAIICLLRGASACHAERRDAVLRDEVSAVHSMTSSADTMIEFGKVKTSVLAVFLLTTISDLVGRL